MAGLSSPSPGVGGLGSHRSESEHVRMIVPSPEADCSMGFMPFACGNRGTEETDQPEQAGKWS